MAKAVEVFTPNSFPSHTYVERHNQFEANLAQTLSIPNMIVSLSGPSKSGKTALVKRVVSTENLIQINGADIRQPQDLWDQVLGWMGAPSEVSATSGSSLGGSAGGRGGGSVGIPLLAQGTVEAEANVSVARSNEQTAVHRLGGLAQVVHEIGQSDFVVFIDDFHYIPRDMQQHVARQIKAAAEQGVKICTASVPHRSDDVVRSNSELHGRIRAIDLRTWEQNELVRIAEQGFAALNVEMIERRIADLAKEAFGSPQLMQAICLYTCFAFAINEQPRGKSHIRNRTRTPA